MKNIIRAALTAKSREFVVLAAESQKDLSKAKELLARFPFTIQYYDVRSGFWRASSESMKLHCVAMALPEIEVFDEYLSVEQAQRWITFLR